MSIDLHVHSSASDGRRPPDVVVAEAAAAGLGTIALTDHDTISGWPLATVAARRHGIRLVPGVEISCQARGISVHMLGYLVDPDDGALRAVLDRTRSSRERRARAIVERISADLPLSWQDVLAQVDDVATIGRPHIADALVALGVVSSRDEAFATILSVRSPYYARYEAPDAAQVVGTVLRSGGVAVIAHPLARRRGRTVGDDVLADLARAGMVGLEVDHRDHEPADRAHLRGIAEDLGLVVTGASDYHGTGKVNLLGENTTDPVQLGRLLDAGRADRVVTP